MRQPREPMQKCTFPPELNPLWGKRVKARISVTHRAVIEIETKENKSLKMPVLEAVDLRIDGYNHTIPRVVVMSPSFWHTRVKMFDTVEFEGVLIREEGKYVGFRTIQNVKVTPFQMTLGRKE